MTNDTPSPEDTIQSIGRHEAITAAAHADTRASEKMFITGITTALVGAAGAGYGITHENGGLKDIGLVTLGGGAALMGASQVRDSGIKRRRKEAEKIGAQIEAAGVELPRHEKPYYTLANGTKLIPQGPFAERFKFPDEPASKPKRR